MSQPLLELHIDAHWHYIYTEVREITGVSPSGRTYIPIPPFEVPTLFHSPILMVRTFSRTAPAHWRFGGMLRQLIQMGRGTGDEPLPIIDATAIRLSLNRRRLIVFPRYTETYQLTLTVPNWITQFAVEFWEYRGPVSDTTAQLIDLTREDLVGIEFKIDDLLTRP